MVSIRIKKKTCCRTVVKVRLRYIKREMKDAVRIFRFINDGRQTGNAIAKQQNTNYRQTIVF